MRQKPKEEGGHAKKRHTAHMVRGVCIHCNKEGDGKPKLTQGYPIKDDYVIGIIRWLKRKTRTEQKNRLVVCEKHADEHEKKRGGFERSLIIYGGIGIFLLVILLLLNLSFGSLIAGLLLLLFLVVTAHIKYVPKAEGI